MRVEKEVDMKREAGAGCRTIFRATEVRCGFRNSWASGDVGGATAASRRMIASALA